MKKREIKKRETQENSTEKRNKRKPENDSNSDYCLGHLKSQTRSGYLQQHVVVKGKADASMTGDGKSHSSESLKTR